MSWIHCLTAVTRPKLVGTKWPHPAPKLVTPITVILAQRGSIQDLFFWVPPVMNTQYLEKTLFKESLVEKLAMGVRSPDKYPIFNMETTCLGAIHK